MRNFIEVENVSQAYPHGNEMSAVLSDVSFSAGHGDFLAVTGPSGCGKSTLLYIIGGLCQPVSGEVFIDGEPLYGKGQAALALYRQKTVGIVYQFYNLVPELTAEENLMLPALMARERPDRARVEGILDFLGMRGKRHFYPDQLSGGQQQKIAIGRALVHHPKLLLADEPTGNLDTEKRDEVLGLFSYLNRQEGMAILLVTHDPVAAQAASRRIQLLDGKIM